MRTRLTLVPLAALVIALAVGSARNDSATADEGAHIAAGMIKLQYGWMSFFAEQPPLMNSLSAAPLLLAGYRVPDPEGPLGQQHWTMGYRFLYASGYDAASILFLARLPTIALLLGLCFVMWWFVRAQTGSEVWAVVAFAMTGLCPNLLAHGRLVTVDLGVTAFLFAATACYLRLLMKPTMVMGIVTGALAACTMLSKTSGLIIGPYFLLLLVLHVVMRKNWRPLVLPLAVAALTSLIVIEAVYLAEISRRYLDAAWPNVNLLTIPIREYARNVEAIRRWYDRGHAHPQFLLGEFSYSGWPHYYFVAFALKTPLAAQLSFLVAIFVAIRRRSFELLACVLFVALFMAISTTSHIALGIRYVLPIYPFVYASIALAFAELARDVKPQRKRAMTAAAVALVGWHAVSGVLAYPGYISYFNELIAPRYADRFLIDSNLDWGQDLHRLKLWCDENGVQFIRIDYFGGGEPAYEFGNRAERFSAPRPELLPDGWFAVSKHFYRVSFFPAASPIDYDRYLAASGATYVTTVGGSIDVYRVDRSPR